MLTIFIIPPLGFLSTGICQLINRSGAVVFSHTGDYIYYIIVFIVALIFIGIWVGNIESYMINTDSSGRAFNNKIEEIEHYMTSRKLPDDIRARISKFYHYRFAQHKIFDEDAILMELNDPLRHV